MLSGSVKTYELLQRSYPQIKKHKTQIGEKTYEHMFTSHPELKALFKDTPPGQSQRLIDAILFYAHEVTNYELFYKQLDKIAHAHIKAGVKNEFYPHMKEAFVKALEDVLQDDADDDLLSAWKYGFDSLSNELIHAENLIRKYSA